MQDLDAVQNISVTNKQDPKTWPGIKGCQAYHINHTFCNNQGLILMDLDFDIDGCQILQEFKIFAIFIL